MFGILAVLIIAAVPAFIAYLIAWFTYRWLVKKGKPRPRRVRNIVFIVAYVVLLVAELCWLFIILMSFER